MKFSKAFSLLAVAMALVNPPAARAAVKTVASPSGPSEGRQATGALRVLFSAYAAGNQLQMSYLVAPEMIGYARVMDAVREEAVTHKQLRLTFSEARVQVDGDTAFIQARWEKRFVLFPAVSAVRQSGAATFTMKRIGSAWKLSGLSGDNPFAGQ